jgi:tRNA (guanine-N7-)-methyltransferase
LNSRPITSSQTGIHTQLLHVVDKHAAHPYLKPVTTYNQQAFDSSIAAWQEAGAAPLILDTGCGVGLSTMHLAAQFPDHFVIGIDQSEDRLARDSRWEGPVPANMTYIRADLVDYWRLLLQHKIFPVRQYLLYPNPWPKIGHLARRWQGHAVFPTIVALGGIIECRSNWQIYVEEFAAALGRLSHQQVACEAFLPETPITPFEQKYLASGHGLWRCIAQLPQQATA